MAQLFLRHLGTRTHVQTNSETVQYITGTCTYHKGVLLKLFRLVVDPHVPEHPHFRGQHNYDRLLKV